MKTEYALPLYTTMPTDARRRNTAISIVQMRAARLLSLRGHRDDQTKRHASPAEYTHRHLNTNAIGAYSGHACETYSLSNSH